MQNYHIYSLQVALLKKSSLKQRPRPKLPHKLPRNSPNQSWRNHLKPSIYISRLCSKDSQLGRHSSPHSKLSTRYVLNLSLIGGVPLYVCLGLYRTSCLQPDFSLCLIPRITCRTPALKLHNLVINYIDYYSWNFTKMLYYYTCTMCMAPFCILNTNEYYISNQKSTFSSGSLWDLVYFTPWYCKHVAYPQIKITDR